MLMSMYTVKVEGVGALLYAVLVNGYAIIEGEDSKGGIAMQQIQWLPWINDMPREMVFLALVVIFIMCGGSAVLFYLLITTK